VTNQKNSLVALSLETGRRQLLIGDAAVHIHKYAPTGHLVYLDAETLMAAPFDAVRLELTGPAMPVQEGVSHYSFSDAG
jgi:hypothetical protein